MSCAYRLIVVWMAGALGTLAVYGARRLQIAEVVALPPPPAQPAPATVTPVDQGVRAAISRYLNIRYDWFDNRDDGGFAYKGAPLQELDDQRLRSLLPDTRFFVTTLHTDYREGGQQQIDLVVSYRAYDDVRSCVVGMSSRPSRRFLSQFIGLPASTPQARRELAMAIAQLFAQGTYERHVRRADESMQAGRAELWRGHWDETHWRDIDVFSDAAGIVSRIAVTNPGERRLEIEVTSFF